MYGTSVFTDILKELCEYSEKVDMGTATHEDFGSLQKLQSRIIKAYREGHFHVPEYSALMTIYSRNMEEYRQALGYNEIYERTAMNTDQDSSDDDGEEATIERGDSIEL